jgi:hypothetical protein
MPVRKMLLVTVALIVLIELFLIFRPEPAIMTAGVALGETPITDMLRKRFPIGSSADALESELKQEGCWGTIRIERIGRSERVWHYVKFKQRVGLFTPRVTTILWEVDDNGRLTEIRGSKWLDIPVP